MIKIPRYIQVAESLRSDIEAGRYAVGTYLPTETALCASFGISRYTVREALRRLVELGVVSRRQGSGTMVLSSEPQERFQQTLGSVQDLLQYAEDTRLDAGSPVELRLSRSTARLLGAGQGSRWFYMRGVRYSAPGGRPIALTDIYIAPAYAARLPELPGLRGPIFARLDEGRGAGTARITQAIRAVNLDKAEAKALKVDPGLAALQTIRHYYAADGTLFEMSVNLHPGDLFTYSMSLEKTPER